VNVALDTRQFDNQSTAALSDFSFEWLDQFPTQECFNIRQVAPMKIH
jgi:hypothetical protein